MTTRAAPMAPAERREALIEATLPLLHKHGRKVSTRQIATAAGVAEGTIFRVFDTKEELVEAAIAKAFAPGAMSGDLDTLDLTLPLRERLVALVTIFQRRFTEIFGLMSKVGMVAPPSGEEKELRERWRRRLDTWLVEFIGDDAADLAVEPEHLLHAARLLTFSGSHPEISQPRRLSPEEIVDLVLYGALRRPEPDPTSAPHDTEVSA